MPRAIPKDIPANDVESGKWLNGFNPFNVESFQFPRIQIYQRKGAYAVFLRCLNKFCLNKLENDKAGSIYIKWKNKLPVIGFFIIFIFLAINFNSAYSDWLWEVGKQETEIEAWWAEQSHGTHSEAGSLKELQWRAFTQALTRSKEHLRKMWFDNNRNIKLSSLQIGLVHFNHIALNSLLSTMSMYLPPIQVKCDK